MSRKRDTNTLDLFAEPPVKVEAVPNQTQADKLPLLEIFFDGGCSPNPGAKYGSFEVRMNGEKILGLQRVQFGYGTSNEAEFESLRMALEHTHAWLILQGRWPEKVQVRVETDSVIVRNRLVKENKIHQKPKWREASERMFKLAEACLERLRKFGAFTVERFGH